MIVNRGGNVNILDTDGNTPLHLACLHHNIDCAKRLIKSDPCFHLKIPTQPY